MKKYIPLVLSIFILGQFTAKAQFSALINQNAYATQKMESYIEFMFLIDGKTTQYHPNEKGRYVSEIEIKVDIADKTNDSIVQRLHYILLSDEFEDTLRTNKAYFSDIKNVKVPCGDYYLYYTLIDIYQKDTINYIDFVSVQFDDTKVSMSKISLWRTMDKSGEHGFFLKYGYGVTPLFQQYAPQSVYALPFTVEIYNTEKIVGKGEKLIIKSSITPAEVYRTAKQENIVYKDVISNSALLFMHQFNIFHLASGNYYLVVEVLDKDSVLLQQESVFFQRSNPSVKLDLKNYDDVVIEKTFVEEMTDLKQLQEDVASLYPIGSRQEQEFFLQRMKKVPLDQLQRYFYSFWMKRNPSDPEGAWNEYKEKLAYVQAHYGSTVIKGYRTDRGRVYLRYGAPTHVTSEPFDPASYPYEIWHYYVIDKQTNVKFIFYNRDLISNNYELLHSDLIGETQDPAWQVKLVRRINPIYNPDITTPEEYWGGNARDQYRYNE